MNKQRKIPTSENTTFQTTFNRKILPLKHKFITFQSYYDYRANYPPQLAQIRIKNPKWCHLSLKLGHTGEYLKLLRLRQAKSLRLRSVHLESYALDSQGCGDRVNRYFGELDLVTRAGHTLKKLSLSVVHSHVQAHFFGLRTKKPDVFFQLKKFVKKQKYLDEFGIYMGKQGDSEWMSGLLRYVEKTIKNLTIENLAIDNIFKKIEFPKLETLRFEYMQFYSSEDTFDFSFLKRSLEDILTLSSLKALVFSQYQRYEFMYSGSFDEDAPSRPLEQLELIPEFWEDLREKLDKYKDKPLKIKYHRKDDEKFMEKAENFKRILHGLPSNQTFEFEVAKVLRLTTEEARAQGLEVVETKAKNQKWSKYYKGIRYLISLDKEESIISA